MVELALKIAITLILVSIGWYFGSRTERKHLQQLAEQEAKLAYIRLSNRRFDTRAQQTGELIVSNVVISQDYFKYIWAQIHGFFGGRLKSYESLLERARREALIRLKQQAARIGADEILAVRISVSEIAGQGSIEILAYGTAIHASQPRKPSDWPPRISLNQL